MTVIQYSYSPSGETMACARSEVVAGQHETAVLVHRRAEVVVVLVPSLGAQRDLGCGPSVTGPAGSSSSVGDTSSADAFGKVVG